MRYPDFLKKGGRIGFIAPSFGCSTEPYSTYFDSALEKFRSMGYETVLGPNCREAGGIGKSNTAEKCGEEINAFFTEDRSDVIISCGGGETMCEDLPFVDFEAIKKAKPKWFMGYSDNTFLTYTLPVLCDTAAVYAPCASSFGMEPWHEAIEDAFSILTGNNLTLHNYDKWEKEDKPEEEQRPLEPYNVTENFEMKVFPTESASFSGRLIGGCMDCLSVLCGTKFDKTKEFCRKYRDDKIIWFLEACEMNPFDIRRALWQMDNASWFENAAGFIFGRPMMYDEVCFGLDRFGAVTDILGKYNLPIIFDADIGHLPPMMPIISGACADVAAKDNKLEIKLMLK